MSQRCKPKAIQYSLRTCMVLSLTGMAFDGFAQEKQPAAERYLLTALEIEQTKTVDEEQSEKDKATVKNADTVKAKEPIALPPLIIPNLSLEGIGTGKYPEDLVEGRLPPMQSLPFGPDRPYGLSLTWKTWTAPVFCHQPLYYEDAMLERHGHERFPHLTPLISGARFFTGIATRPYMMYLHPPLEDVQNTGHFRPGSPAPGIRERAPYDKGALRFQLLTTGATFVAIQP